MNCGKEATKPAGNNGTGYIILIVLYILLAIIIGSWFC
jgi:hypothetical protein